MMFHHGVVKAIDERPPEFITTNALLGGASLCQTASQSRGTLGGRHRQPAFSNLPSGESHDVGCEDEVCLFVMVWVYRKWLT